MKQSFRSAPPEAWNQKNLPSGNEDLDEEPGQTSELLRQVPAAVKGFARRRPIVVWALLAGVAGLGLVLYFSKES